MICILFFHTTASGVSNIGGFFVSEAPDFADNNVTTMLF
nr:MAG TPA_asm: hypothetical protein [Caudoviricetes sp.]